MKAFSIKPVYHLPIIIVIASLFLFWELGQHDVTAYDEARNGVNAWNMYHNHDYVNYYYGDDIDTWNAKPPLLIWLITLSYKIFGFNEFALRLPAALAALIFFVVLYRLIKLFETPATAFLTCIILLGCRAIAAHHVGRSGDFDALLLLFLTCSIYYLCKYLYFGQKSGIYLFALLTGLAFYSKGTAALLYMPGIFLFLLFTKQLLKVLKDYRTYLSILLFVGIMFSWIMLVYMYHKTARSSVYESENSIETMLVHDTFNRLTSSEFESGVTRDNFFFFHTAEVRMNMWHILFYLSLATGVYYLVKNRRSLGEILQDSTNRFTILSICLMLPVSIIVNFAEHPLDWYLAPAWSFVAFITARWMILIAEKWKPVYYLWLGVIMFNLVKQFMYIDASDEAAHDNLSRRNPLFKNEQYVVVLEPPQQHVLLYLHWMNMPFVKADVAELQNHTGKTAIVNTIGLQPEQVKPVNQFKDHYIGTIK